MKQRARRVLFQIACLCTMILCASPVQGTTGVSGVVSSNTTWGPTSPQPEYQDTLFIITADVTVDEGTTLTIEAGVTLEFVANTFLQVDGQLIARGTEDDPIRFTSTSSTPSPGDWGYIYFTETAVDATYDGGGNYTGGSILEYCIIEYAGNLGYGAIRLNDGLPYIASCTISSNAASGIEANILSGTVRITGNTISGNTLTSANGGGISLTGGDVYLSDNTITGNDAGTAAAGEGKGGALYLDGGSGTVTGSFITGNTARDGGAIYSRSGTYTITANTIHANIAALRGGGLYLENGDHTVGANLIVNNAAAEKGGGVFIAGPETPALVLAGNVIAGNTSGDGGGVSLGEPGDNEYTGLAQIAYNSIVSNATGASALEVFMVGDYSLAVSYNTVWGNSYSGSSPRSIASFMGPTLDNNNLVDAGADYGFYNLTGSDSGGITAEFNWWGTGATTEIQELVYDWYDDTSKSVVDFTPFMTGPVINAPVIPPFNVRKHLTAEGMFVRWNANLESDLAGYKIYYGEPTGYSFTTEVDVGNVTGYILTGVTVETEQITVTAYDTAADGTDDHVEGRESWFSEARLVHAPEIDLLAPNNGEYWSGEREITWTATDADGEELKIALYLSDDIGVTWTLLAYGEPNDGSYTWDSMSVPDGGTYKVKVSADDGDLVTVDQTDVEFVVDNYTEVSGTITTNTTWAEADSPFMVTGDILVNAGVSLTVEPGSTVTFTAGTYMQVNGRLEAQGTAETPIIFTSASFTPAPGDWGYIYLTDTSDDAVFDTDGSFLAGSVLENCVVEYAGSAGLGALWVEGAAPYINNCTVRYNELDGIYCEDLTGESDRQVRITNNLVSKNRAGIIFYASQSSALLSGNIVSDCREAGVEANGYGPEMAVRNNVVVNNQAQDTGGLTTNGTTCEITGNIIGGNYGRTGQGGLNSRGGGILSGNAVVGNGAGSSSGAAAALIGGTLEVSSNIVAGNTQVAALTEPQRAITVRTDPVFRYNTFVNGTTIEILNESTTPEDIDAASNWWGTTIFTEIENKIQNWVDDPLVGDVTFLPYLTAADLTAPLSPPTGVTTEVNGSDLVVTWTANQEADLAGYRVYYGNATGYSFDNVLDAGNVTSCTLINTPASTRVAVTAYDADADGVADTDGVTDQAEGVESWFGYADQAPDPPDSLEGTAGDAIANLVWTKADGVAHAVAEYRVYRTTVSGSGYLSIVVNQVYGSTFEVSNTMTDEAVVNGTRYFYAVSAVNVHGQESAYSNEVSLIPFAGTRVYPPGNLEAEAFSGEVELAWYMASPGDLEVAGYYIYRSTSPGSGFIPVNIEPITSVSYTDTGLTNGTTYYYYIAAVDTSGVESDFSNQVSARPNAAPQAALVSPIGGEEWTKQQTILWTATDPDNDPVTIDLLLSNDSGGTWAPLVTGEENDGSYSWDTMAHPSGITYRVRVVADDGTEATTVDSAADFRIRHNVAPTVTLTAPVGGETLGGEQDITWAASDPDGDPVTIDLFYSVDSGENWLVIVTDDDNDGIHSWDTALLTDGTRYRVKVVVDDNDLTDEDQSASDFAINNNLREPVITLLSPTGGETLGGEHDITWTASDPDGDDLVIHIYYSDDSGTLWTLIVASTENDGSYTWNTAGVVNGGTYRMRVLAYDGNFSSSDQSSSDITITNGNQLPQVTVTAPNGGETWAGIQNVTWTATDADDDPLIISIYYRLGPDGNWRLIVSDKVNDGVYPWATATILDGSTYRLKVVAFDGNINREDESDADFTVNNTDTNSAPEVNLIEPNGGEIWSFWREVTWTATDADDDTVTLDISISLTGGLTWSVVATSEANDGTYLLNTVPFPELDTYRIKLVASDGEDTTEEISDGLFTIYNGLDELPPVAPQGLVAASGNGVVYLEWQDSREPDMAYYSVYRSESPIVTPGVPLVPTLIDSKHKDFTAVNGISYYYAVTATDQSLRESGLSNQVPAAPESTAPVGIISADVTEGQAPLTVTLTVGATDDGNIVRYGVLFGDGDWYDSPVPGTITHTYTAAGSFYAKLIVLDDTGLVSEPVNKIIRVESPTSVPVAFLHANVVSGAAPLQVTFSFSGADVRSSIVSYEIDFEADAFYNFSAVEAGTVTFTYGRAGMYLAILRVTNALGLTATDQVVITVGSSGIDDIVPEALCSGSGSYEGPLPLTVSFSGTATGGNPGFGGSYARYFWDFEGDANFDWESGTSAAVSHTYTEAGTYAPVLKVEDSTGLWGTDTCSVIVNPPGGSLGVWMEEPAEGDTVWGSKVTLKAEVSPAVLLQQVQFQYRISGAGVWTDIGSPVTGVNGAAFASWSVVGFTEGTIFDLRAEADSQDGGSVQSGVITVTVSSAEADIEEGLDQSGRCYKKQTVSYNQTTRVELADGTVAEFPYGTLTSDTAATITAHEFNPVSGSGVIGELIAWRDITLEGDPDLGRMVTITLPYEETNGIVNGTNTEEEDLVPHYWDGAQWVRISPFQLDTVSNRVTFTVGHLTLFALLAPEEAVVLTTGGSDKGSCFIATAAYGSTMTDEVKLLQRFRDRYLETNGIGRGVVRLYYTLSPPLARIIGADEKLRSSARNVLQPVILMVTPLVESRLSVKSRPLIE